jgi:phosphoribosylformimino-5-aminoimidazole carboxamide ribotide isomerase
MGITNFLVTNIERDGTMEGPDIETINHVCSNLGINAIASGGISCLLDIIKLAAVGCRELILGKSLYEGTIDLKKAKAIL